MKRIKRLLPYIIGLVLALVSVGLLIAIKVNGSSLISQQAARQWRGGGEMAYSQVSCFTDEGNGMSAEYIPYLEQKIAEKLSGEALEAANDSARLWTDAYCGQTTATAQYGDGTAEARTVCTGGDFFQINSIQMFSGWYYTSDDVMNDRVVIGKELAWKLYGGYDLTDMEITVNGERFLIAGVCDDPAEETEIDAYGDGMVIYMPIDRAENAGLTVTVTSYIAVLPNPVPGFALSAIKESVAYSEDQCVYVENTTRFGLKNSFNVLKEFNSRVQRSDGVSFPWWENAARIIENRCALLLLFAMIAAVYPIVLIFVLFVRLILHRGAIAKKLGQTVKNIRKRTNEKKAGKAGTVEE